MLSNVWEYMYIYFLSTTSANTLGTGGVAHMYYASPSVISDNSLEMKRTRREKKGQRQRKRRRACALSDKFMVLNRQKNIVFGLL